MISSCIKYFILVHSVCATCDGVAKNDKACKASFTSKEVIMVQRVAAKVNSTPGKRNLAKLETVPKVASGGQQDRLASFFSMAVSKLEAQRDRLANFLSINGKLKSEISERKQQYTIDNNQAESRETESREAERKEAERQEVERQGMEVTVGNTIKLAGVSELLSKPKHVLETLSSNVRSLEASLSEVQRKDVNAIKTQKAEYEMTLESQRHNNTILAQKNKNTSDRITALSMSNEGLRSRAQKLTKQCASLAADLKDLQANISSAHEFIENALGTSAEKLSTAPQLSVLRELAQKDAEIERNRDHENRLNQIRVAMLQTGANVSNAGVGIDVGSILASLESDLRELVKTHNASVAFLKDAFEKAFKAGARHRNELLTEERQLNTAETAALDLKERLTAAVKHLERTREALLQKNQNVRQYVQGVGSRARLEQK